MVVYMRAFIAFNLPEELKDRLCEIQKTLKSISNKGSWVSRENFHLTLKFLGEIDERHIKMIDKLLKDISEANPPLTINLNKLGYFNRKNNEYGVIWSGLGGDIDRLGYIYNLIEEEMGQMGFYKERRKFSPHITLARRFRANLDFHKIREDIRVYLGNNYVLENLVLMKSEVIMNKRIYTPVVSYNLIENNK